MMKRILFVCTGNTCRSPMAEIILKNKLKLANLSGIRVSSAGLCANEGSKISQGSKHALKVLGLKSYSFRSRQITQEMIEKSDVVICMTDSHKQALLGFDNVYTVSEICGTANIPDPYGQGLNVYVRTSHAIEDACNLILEKIINEP